jgi:outer membrane protein
MLHKQTIARNVVIPGIRILSILSVLIPMIAGIASGQADTISLDQAVKMAQEHNLNIGIAQNDVSQSKAHYRELKANRYPLMSLGSHYLYAPDQGYDPAVTNGGGYGLQLNAGLPLYDGGIRSAQVHQAANALERSQWGEKKAKSEIAFSVRSVYYEILRTQTETDIRKETVQRLKDYAVLLQGLQAGGNATESDVLKTQVELNNALIELDGTEKSVNNAKILLDNLMGKPLAYTFDVAPLSDQDTTFLSNELPKDNLDLRLTQYDEKSASYDLIMAKRERLPTLSIAGDVGAFGLKPNEFRNDLGYSALLSLNVPIFTWGGIKNRIQQKEYDYKRAQMQFELQRREVETEWYETINDVRQFEKNLVGYTRNNKDAENNYLSAKSRFVGGTGSSLEVLDAQRLLLEAKLNLNNTYFQLRTATANLIRLNGG